MSVIQSRITLAQEIPTLGIHIGDEGASKYTPDGADPVSMKEKQGLIDAYDNKIRAYKEYLITWMKDNNSNGVFDTITEVKEKSDTNSEDLLYGDCECNESNCSCIDTGGVWVG